MSVTASTHQLGDAQMKTHHVDGQTLFRAFHKRLFAMIRTEESLRNSA